MLAGNDPVRMREIWRTTPVRDGLECFFRMLQEDAKTDFMHSQMLFVQGGLKKAPKVPDILKRPKSRKRRKGPFKEPEKPEFLKRLEMEQKAETTG